MEGIYPERKNCKRSLFAGVGSSRGSRLGNDPAARGFIAALLGQVGSGSFAKGTKITIYSPMWTITFSTWVLKRASWAITPFMKLEAITLRDIKDLSNASCWNGFVGINLRLEPQFPMYSPPGKRGGLRLGQKTEVFIIITTIMPPSSQILNSSPILHEAGSLMGILCSKNTYIHMKSLKPNIYWCNTFSFVYWLKS